MVYKKKIFFYISLLYDYGRWWPPRRGQFRPQGHDWQGLLRVPLNIATH